MLKRVVSEQRVKEGGDRECMYKGLKRVVSEQRVK